MHKPNRHSHSFISLPPNISQVSRSTVQAYKFTHTHTHIPDKTEGIAGDSETTPAHCSKSSRSLFAPIELAQQTTSGSAPAFSPRTCAIVLLRVKPWLCFLNPPPVAGVQGGQTLRSGVCVEGGYKYLRISLLA